MAQPGATPLNSSVTTILHDLLADEPTDEVTSTAVPGNTITLDDSEECTDAYLDAVDEFAVCEDDSSIYSVCSDATEDSFEISGSFECDDVIHGFLCCYISF